MHNVAKAQASDDASSRVEHHLRLGTAIFTKNDANCRLVPAAYTGAVFVRGVRSLSKGHASLGDLRATCMMGYNYRKAPEHEVIAIRPNVSPSLGH
mmetsp:Transcript_25407/g.40647  ORF Transcript_25407/g.40647 Transcript_25407/m.40647 type:complete len:96 (-) Transcript_25407:80-367(-)